MDGVIATAQQPAGSAPALGQSEHDKAMMAKVDTLAGTPPAQEAPAKPERPAHIPEKFWDAEKGEVRVEEMAKSYAELEKARQTPAAKKDDAAPPAEGSEGAESAQAKAAAEAAKAAGADPSKIDFAALQKSYLTNGSLSEDDYKSLSAAGLSKEVVDGWIAGQEALAQKQTQEAYDAVGGKEAFEQMLAWAGANYSQAERDAFDEAVVGSSAARMMALQALQARYTAAMGSDPAARVRGGSGSAESGAYQSRDEVTRDMRDPRYKSDPAFRDQVARKLAASSVF